MALRYSPWLSFALLLCTLRYKLSGTALEPPDFLLPVSGALVNSFVPLSLSLSLVVSSCFSNSQKWIRFISGPTFLSLKPFHLFCVFAGRWSTPSETFTIAANLCATLKTFWNRWTWRWLVPLKSQLSASTKTISKTTNSFSSISSGQFHYPPPPLSLYKWKDYCDWLKFQRFKFD
jgi:hypothetical protein